jgi:hypothetical protein
LIEVPSCALDSPPGLIKNSLTYVGDDLEEISKIPEILNPDEKVLLVARQSKIKPGGSHFTPNIIYAANRRIIVRDPYMLGIKENGLLFSTIIFKAPGLMSSTKLRMIDSIVDEESYVLECLQCLHSLQQYTLTGD